MPFSSRADRLRVFSGHALHLVEGDPLDHGGDCFIDEAIINGGRGDTIAHQDGSRDEQSRSRGECNFGFDGFKVHGHSLRVVQGSRGAHRAY